MAKSKLIWWNFFNKRNQPVIDVSAQPLLTFNEPEWIKQETLVIVEPLVIVESV